MSFEVADDGFRCDGEPFRIISGSLHYFRVHPDQWDDRLRKARQLGLNTIDTYVAWNFHSSREGEFRTDGWRDLGRFLDLAEAHGLYAIVRPGPYICAEWRNAGLPTWLTARPGIKVRTSDPLYLDATADFYRAVLPIVADRQVSRGGNVVMVQVENEYGAYGDDAAYLRSLVALIRGQGIDVPLFTCDQANDEMLTRGGLPELLRTGTFGSRSKERLATLRRHQPTGPLMCTEFWNGWFDSWGQQHHTTAAQESAADLDDLLAAGASVNLYMLHGGTNFGLNNGANDKGVYVPITTSYDYDAPLREDGAPGPKFHAFREVISRHAPVPAEAPSEFVPAPEFEVDLGHSDWTAVLPESFESFDRLPEQDEVDPEAIFAVYEADVTADDQVVVFDEVRDRVFGFLDSLPIGSVERTQHQRALTLPGAGRLRLLVEDLGRVNYAARLGESKGLIGPARTAVRELTNWRIAAVDHDSLPTLTDGADTLPVGRPVAGPVLLSGTFDAAGVDLFLDTSGFGTGIVWINGVLLGRYWSAGPTTTMFVPGPLLREQHNSIVVWELAAASRPVAKFVSDPQLGHTEA
ncbi:beta-galactosidase [Tessaracoccus bendigoensis DSM 12906]|uniref:Beta-galactosidase n=1 Tax=Tessaracoccus bendigoensis DSM 12906 TaxID=1123357 RepID=A0A1M6E2W2_9ACTN|nr:beta-galactosidase [Tessaracoccus bendigoensis]SHI79832.1 beta-galactosidase [Tessaracoccus bendigoensis DSM 12906]